MASILSRPQCVEYIYAQHSLIEKSNFHLHTSNIMHLDSFVFMGFTYKLQQQYGVLTKVHYIWSNF